MENIFFENRQYFEERIRNLEKGANALNTNTNGSEASTETPDTAVCVRIRPLTDHEIKQDHIIGVLTDNHEVVSIHEPRIKINSKPDLNVGNSFSKN